MNEERLIELEEEIVNNAKKRKEIAELLNKINYNHRQRFDQQLNYEENKILSETSLSMKNRKEKWEERKKELINNYNSKLNKVRKLSRKISDIKERNLQINLEKLKLKKCRKEYKETKTQKLFNKHLEGKAEPEDLDKHELENAHEDIKKKSHSSISEKQQDEHDPN